MITVERLRDYLDQHVSLGRGHNSVSLDRRGLQYFDSDKHQAVTIGIPPDGETVGDGVVFVRAIF